MRPIVPLVREALRFAEGLIVRNFSRQRLVHLRRFVRL